MAKSTPLSPEIAPNGANAPAMALELTPPKTITNGHTSPNGADYGDGAAPVGKNASIEGKGDGKAGWTPGFRAQTSPEKALKWARHFTQPGENPFETLEWEMRTAGITGEDGKSVFEQTGCEIPKSWSQLATNVVVSKYFRGPINSPQRETSVKQVIGRVADTIHAWGNQGGYFASPEDAQSFRDELVYLLVHQYGAFNSPVWFNLGVKDARQQCSACFINDVYDDMESIMELAATEARLFKGGSGAGVNLWRIRSSREQLRGGGIASGPISFMRGWDAFAGAVKSGGTTRRAAKMVILNADHPDIGEFISCKADEEKKAWALIESGYNGGFNVPGGAYDSVDFQNANHSVRVTDEFMRAAENGGQWQTRAVTSGKVVEDKSAREMLQQIAEATWICGDPGMQFDTIINDWHTCANSDRIYASNPCSEFMFLNSTACVTQETRVSTPEGLRKIVDLYESQQRGEAVYITTEIAGEHDLRRLSAHRRAFVTKTGEREVFKIGLADGRRIRATADHRFLTETGWKRVDQLEVKSDRLQLRQIGNAVAFTSDEAEVKRWQMLGWLTGEGVFSRENVALVFGPEEAETAREMEGEFNRLIADARAYATVEQPVLITVDGEARLPEIPRGGSHIYCQANGVMQINSKSQALVNYLEEWYGFKQGTAIFKDVPSGLHQAPDDLKVAYLQGLFSADGCIRHDPRGRNARAEEVMLASSSPELLRSVQLLLGDLGLTSRIGWTHPAGRTNPQGQLHLYNQQGRNFLALIGFPCSPKKTEYAAQITGQFFDANIQRPRPATVVSIEPDCVETVYDLTEPVTHSFIAEGIITHNCNLASLNLLKFYDMNTGVFDAESYSKACETFLTAQEIIVSFASYPTEKIGEMSEQYRPLGLGYANLGALLMAKGLAYDSDEGRALAGALTAIMTGAGYRKSAQIARNTGPFEGYAENREPMLRVIAKHRDAVNGIDATLVAQNVMDEARKVWDDAYMTGQKHGYRNSQATVLAPTGTISFMMDCDTTGVEPDIALVKYKKLVGGGLLKIVNQTVPAALRNLGYDEAEIKSIVEYIDKNDTIEGAPGLDDAHLSVFDCAFKAMNGTRSIHHMGHIKMMAATQPFISGAISKTVNMPQDCTADEIYDAYLQSWKMGVKAVAIYRDGSKRTQPLSTASDAQKAEKKEGEVRRAARRKLPDERNSITHKFSIAGQEGYFMVGLYEDGSPGEIFIKMSKEGSTISGLMDSFAVAVSMCLQYGVPLRVLVNKFSHTRFEPSGYTTNRDIPIAKSLMDYIFRWFDLKFHPNGDNGHVGKAAPETKGETAESNASIFEAKSSSNGSAHGNVGNAQREVTQMQQDAPPCPDCGALTVRSGACYKCNECGATTGCG